MKNASLVTLEGPRALISGDARLPALFLPTPAAAERFFGFLTVNIRSKNTR